MIETILTSVIVALLTGLITAFQQIRLQDNKNKKEWDKQERQIQANLEHQEVRLRTELKTEFMAENVARNLLDHPKAPYRSFRILRHHLGGFDDDELRRILVRAGAIRTKSKSGHELWILVDRMREQTNTDNEFFWRIGQDPNTPDEKDLFPNALPQQSSVQ